MAITKYPTWSGAGTYMATLTASGSANTKGAYTQLTAATAEALRGLYVTILNGNTSTAGYLVDLAVGAASAEVVIIPNLGFCTMGLGLNPGTVGLFIPVTIASGVRLAARCQANVGGATVGLAVLAVGGPSTATVNTYGVQSSLSRPSDIDPGSVANTKGSYVQLTAATSAAIDWAIVLLTGRQNGAVTAGTYTLDIATGASASEVVVVGDLTFAAETDTRLMLPLGFALPLTVASGTRLAARAASTVTDATDRLFCCQVIGITNSGLSGGTTTGTATSVAYLG